MVPIAGGAAQPPLLPGEAADSSVREDVEHWVAVYEELIGFLHGSEPPDGLLERYRQRLAFWRCRRDQVAEAALWEEPG